MNGVGLLAVMIPGLAGGVAMLAALRVRGQPWPVQLLAFLQGGLLGVGLASVPLPLIVVYAGSWPTWWPWAEVAVWGLLTVAAVGLWCKSPRHDRAELPPTDWRLAGPVLLVFLLALVAAALTISYAFRVSPHGEWDAMHIWNYHARFFARDQGQFWRNILAIDDHHAEYPLLLPCSVARVWALDAHESQLAPHLIALLFGVGTTGVLMLSLGRSHGCSTGLLAGSFWLAPAWVSATVSALYADVPLACWYTCAISVWTFLTPKNVRWVAVLSGLFAGLAAWTKNEGLPYAALLGLGVTLWTWRISRRTGWYFLLGAAGFVGLNLWWKLQSPHPNDLVAGQQAPLQKLLDLARWETLANIAWKRAAPQYGLTLLAVVLTILIGWRTRGPLGLGLLALGVAAALFSVYVLTLILTPHELPWHVDTSINRLVLHVWPLLIFGGLSLTQTSPERLGLPAPMDAGQ